MTSTRKFNKITQLVIFISLNIFIMVFFESSSSAENLPYNTNQPLDIPTVESEHPYNNNYDNFWTVEFPGANSTRIHFARVELEENADYLIISDPSDKRTQVITGSYPDGLWTDPVPGEYVRVRLVTDSNVRRWGFLIDQKEALNFSSFERSSHPYYGNSNETWTVTNPNSNLGATRIHFSKLDLEENVDFLIVSDINGNPHQYITGSYPDGLWSTGIPGIAVQLNLVTDGSFEGWGFNVDAVESTTADSPSLPVESLTLAESSHPYEEDITEEWIVTNPVSNAVSSKVHFSRIDLNKGDIIQLLDADDVVVQTFGPEAHDIDLWSDYLPGRIVKVRLTTVSVGDCCSCCDPDWGFRIDNISAAVSNPGLVQSDHPYEEDITEEWIVTNPNPAAEFSRVHFSRLDLNKGDKVELLNTDDTIVQTFVPETHKTNVWSDSITGRVVKVRFTTVSVGNCCSCCDPDWGFRIDEVYPSSAITMMPASVAGIYLTVVEPSNLYLNDAEVAKITEAGEYKISLPTEGSYTIRVRYHDFDQLILVEVDKEHSIHVNYVSSKVKLYSTVTAFTPASITGINIRLSLNAVIFLNNSHVISPIVPGDYKISLTNQSNNTIRVEHFEGIQNIAVTLDANDSEPLPVYLPLVNR